MNYTALAERSARLVQNYGKSVTITRDSGTFNATTQELGTGTTTYTTYAVEDNYNSAMRVMLSSRQGTLIDSTDRRFWVAVVSGQVVQPDDRITVDGVTLNVVRVDAIKPGSTTLLWEVQARG
jgi:hypothetical protein